MYEPTIPIEELGAQCNWNVTHGRIVNCYDDVLTLCVQEKGRSHPRCVCRPGFASRYNAMYFQCEGNF